MTYTETEIQELTAQWLDRELESYGKKAARLAELCDVSPVSVSRWRKTGKMSLENLLVAMEYCGTRPDFLNNHGRVEDVSAEPPFGFDLEEGLTALVDNIAALMKRNGLNREGLIERTGVSAVELEKILSRDESVNLDSVQLIAQAFGMEGWMMIIPGGASMMADDTKIKEIFAAYAALDDELQSALARVAVGLSSSSSD